jgi:hypothetical protein
MNHDLDHAEPQRRDLLPDGFDPIDLAGWFGRFRALRFS